MLQRHWMTLGSAAVAATLGASMMFTLTPAGAATATAGSGAAVQVAASKAKTKLKGWSVKAATVRLGGALGATVTVAPKGKRQVAVQYRKRGTSKWLTQSKVTSSSAGSAYVSFAPPKSSQYDVRLVVAATRAATKVASGTRLVTVKGTAGITKISKMKNPAHTIVGERFVMTGVVKPGGVRRIEIDSRPPHATTRVWTPLVVAKTNKAGEYRAAATLNRPGEWRLRITVAGSPTMQPFHTQNLIRPMPRLKFNVARAAGLALAPAKSVGVNTAATRSAVATAQASSAEPTLVAVSPDGTLTNAVASGQASVGRFLIAPNDDVYILFNTPSDIDTGSYGRCLLARVDRASGAPACVDSTLSSVAWTSENGTSLNPAVQFDDHGGVYYAGFTNDGHTVLRKVANGATVDLINDAIWVRDFVVAGDGSVFLKGHTSVTGAWWFRRIKPQGGLETIPGETGNLLYKFPDGDIYFGQTVGGTYGVRHYSSDTHAIDPTFWIGAGKDDGVSTGYRDITPFCTGPGASANADFCSSAGTSVGRLVTTPSGAVYGLAGHVMQYFPTLAKPDINVGSITAISAAGQSDLVIAGLTDGVNVLTRWDAETNSETEILGAGRETEIYRLHYLPATNTVMFDGLRFADNTYIVGRVDLATLQVTASPTGSGQLVDFQTF